MRGLVPKPAEKGKGDFMPKRAFAESIALAKKLWPSSFSAGADERPRILAEDANALNIELRKRDAFKASSMSRGAHKVKR